MSPAAPIFSARAGERMAARILDLVTIPFCPLGEVVFRDELGPIPYAAQAGEVEMSFVHREFYLPQRDTQAS